MMYSSYSLFIFAFFITLLCFVSMISVMNRDGEEAAHRHPSQSIASISQHVSLYSVCCAVYRIRGAKEKAISQRSLHIFSSTISVP